MYAVEHWLIEWLLRLATPDQINAFLGSPRTTAVIVGTLIALAAALPGTFLLLRKMSLTSDAISHTVLLGIVVAFLLMVGVLGMQPDLSSPWLIVGAAAAGVLTIAFTDLLQRSGLVKQDAALGLAFTFLFALSILLIARFIDNTHLDTHAVFVGEIGVAWANTNSHCLENCETVEITPQDPRAKIRRECTNCRAEGISPRDARAVFSETCANCGTYSPAEAWREGLIDRQPQLVFWPRSITVTGILAVLAASFILVCYKELKLSAFDPALAKALGFRPHILNYGLIVLVSLVAVGAFDAVGSILVIAFFILPPATAFLLTDRLGTMLTISPAIGALSVYLGYDLSRGSLFGLVQMSDMLRRLDAIIGLGGYVDWNVSISASIVIMMFLFFLLAWVLSPRHGLISAAIRRRWQRQEFAGQMILGHIRHHQHGASADQELAVDELHTHLRWPARRTQRVLARLRAHNLVQIQDGYLQLTERGEKHSQAFLRSPWAAGESRPRATGARQPSATADH